MAKGSKRKVSDSKDKAAELPETSVKAADFSLKPVVQILVIVILGILIYSNTFNFPFAFDDTPNIVNNPAIKSFRYFIDPSLAEKDHLTNFYQGRFVGYLTFAVNYKMHALHVTGYHVFNLLIHLLNALLVYWLVVLTLRTPYASDHFQKDILKTSAPYCWLPLFTALLFVAHPVQTQTVTYIVQRFTSLATLFFLLSLVMYIKARGLDSSKKARYLFYAMSIISAVLAMRTKEIAFTLPVMIILYEWMFFKGDVRKRLLYIFPFLLTLPIIPLTLMGFKDTPASFGGIDEITRIGGIGLSRWDYLNTQFRVIVTYIRLLFFPVNQNLDYDYPLYRTFFNPEVLLSFLFLVALFGMGIYLLYKSYRAEQGKRFWLRLVSLGILWFFVTLSVESSIIPISDLIFEHRLYLPSVGFFMALLSGIILIKENWASRVRIVEKALIPVMISVVIGLSVAAYARNMVWQDEGTLWADVIKKSPNKARSHYNLGLFYQDQGRLDDAINAYETAIKLKPDDAKAFYNLAICYEKQGRLDEAINAYQTAIKLKPDYADAYFNLGLLHQMRGRLNDAIKAYEAVIKLKPDYAEAHFNMGTLYQNQGRLDDAIKEYQTAIKSKPDYAEAHNNLGAAYIKQGRLDVATVELQMAIKLKSDYAEAHKAHNNLGGIYFIQGRLDDAVKSYQSAIKLKPDYTDAYFNLGLLHQMRGRLNDAEKAYHAALKIDPNHKDARNNLENLRSAMKTRH